MNEINPHNLKKIKKLIINYFKNNLILYYFRKMEEKNSEDSQKIPTNLVSKEERYLRMFFTYLRVGKEKLKSKLNLEKILLKDKKVYNENIEKLKDDWITVYYNIYDYFICKEDYIYTYFYNELLYLCNEKKENNIELKNLVISMMKICLKIYPPPRDDIVNFYQLFRSKELNHDIFSLLMEIFNMLFSFDPIITSYKQFFSSFVEKEFYLFDGNSQIDINLDPAWIHSGFRENPKADRSPTYFVFGFTFRYFNKFENAKLAQVRFPSNKYLILSIKDGFLHSNISLKDNIQIPLLENKDYSFTLAFFKERIQININDKFYDTAEGLMETAKNIIIGDKFFGIFYKVFGTFTFEPLLYNNGSVEFTHPDNGGKFHFFNVSPCNIYESINYPKKIYFIKNVSNANVSFSGRVLLFKTERSYKRSLKNYGTFDSFIILLMFFIHRPEFYKKEYIKIILDKIIENCSLYSNEKIFAENNYFVQICITLCNFPKENRDLEIVDYLAPLTKYSENYNYYFDIMKLVYNYDPKNNKQPFHFHLIEILIKKIIIIRNYNELNEIKDMLLNILEHYNLGIINTNEGNIAEVIYNYILLYFRNFKSPDKDIFFYVPNFFWFITLYIYFFELKNKIKEVEIIYNQIKENFNKNEDILENNEILKLLNYYILLYYNEKVDYFFDNQNNLKSYIYISYIFKLYSRVKGNKNFEDLISNNLKNINNILQNYQYLNIESYKNKEIFNFLIPCTYKLPYITKYFKKDENSTILEILFEDLFLNEPKSSTPFKLIKLCKNICINIKYVNTKSNGYLINCIKKEIFKQVKKYDFDVNNIFYTIFDNDKENAKLLNIDISDLFGDLYSKLEKDKKDKKNEHEISKNKLKSYLDPENDLYQNDGLLANLFLEEIITNMISRKNWIRTTQDDQFYYNQNWSDFDFCYNPDNKNPKYTLKAAGTNDLKFPYLYRIPNITKVIKKRTTKGIPNDKIDDLFNDKPVEPFPICVNISTKDIKLNLEFLLKYREDLNLQIEKEYLTNNNKKYPCCIIGSTLGKGFFYIKDENTIEYANYYNLDKVDNYNCLDGLNGLSTDRRYFYNPVKIYKITIKKENIKMFFRRITYYDDQGLEIFLFLGGSWYFVFKDKRDEFLEEAGLLIKDDKDKEKDEIENQNDDLSFYVSKWRTLPMFKVLYNDLNHKSGLFNKSTIKEPIGYISKYFRFPDDNKYWENPCLSDLLTRWKEHKISTYTLLMYLNIFSGRSIEDETQNPIMPSLILLNHDNKIVLRNLKLPIGQQKIDKNEAHIKRISHFDNLYKKEKDKKQAYFYPSSVSSEKLTSKYLSLIVPYNQISKNLFQDKNNTLSSINKEIIESLTNINNISESISQFFYLFACFYNVNNIKGMNTEGVELPDCTKFINNTNYNFDKSVVFILTLNKILESKEVNDTIGNWIDLIFGAEQKSEKLKNIYKPECYINDKEQLEIFKNDKQIIENLKYVGTLPLQLIKSTKFSSLVTRKYLSLNLNFPIKETITVTLNYIEDNEMLNFTALDSVKYVFFGENKLFNINTKTIKNNHSISSSSLNNKTGVIKELFNPKVFKKIFAISRLYNYSVFGGNIDDVIVFCNHRSFDRAYNNDSKNKNYITAVEIIDYVGYEHYLLVGKKNGHIHHYKVDFETLDDTIKFPDDNQFPGFFYKSILRYHSKEIISIKYNCYLNLWISTSKDGYVHIWNYNGYPILSVFIQNKNIKYAIMASDPIPCFIVYFDNEIDCYILNQVRPVRKLVIENELYNFDTVKSNCFEDYLICQDDNKIYIISLPYLEIIYEINEKFTSFDYLPAEKLIIGFLRHENESKVTIKKIKCDL